MNIDRLNSQQLQAMLAPCTSKQPLSGQHRTLCFKKESGKVYIHCFASVENQKKSGYQKASLEEIRSICHYVLSKDQNSEASSKVLQSLHKIAENKHKKLNTLAKRVGRVFLSVLKYVFYSTVIGIPFGLMIRKKQEYWNREQAQINELLFVTSSADREMQALIKNWNSKGIRKKLQPIISKGIVDDLKEKLSDKQVKSFVDISDEVTCPVILDSLRRDHTRGCIAKYTLEDEETGVKQPIDPLSDEKNISGDQHFGKIILKIQEFNDQGSLHQYSSYIQALMCQNILQGLIYQQKSELQAGAWQSAGVDPRRVVSPDYSGSKPCEVGLADVTLTVKKGKGKKPRIIHVEGAVELKSNLVSTRAIDARCKKPLEFKEPSRQFRATISFDLQPKSFDDQTFSLRNFSVHTTMIR